jgi:hypothetical protein
VAKLKTEPTKVRPSPFIAGIADAATRRDCRTLMAMMKKATGALPTMWGPSIVGYGRHHYVSQRGRGSDWFMAGFSPRKGTLSIYCVLGFEGLQPLLKRLGTYKTGNSRLYIKRLVDVDTTVLERLIVESVKRQAERGDACG